MVGRLEVCSSLGLYDYYSALFMGLAYIVGGAQFRKEPL